MWLRPNSTRFLRWDQCRGQPQSRFAHCGHNHRRCALRYGTRDPGADDNASGVAGLIELACIARQRRFDAHLRFVFFDGEERGRAGSRAYLMNPDRRQNVVGALVLEMIGATCHKPGCQMWPGTVPEWMRRADGQFIAAVGDIETAAYSHQSPWRPGQIAQISTRCLSYVRALIFLILGVVTMHHFGMLASARSC